MRVLIPVDGSQAALNAIEYVIAKRGWFADAPEVHLINVQGAFTSDVSRFFSRDEVRAYHDEEGVKAVAPAKARLEAAGLAHSVHLDVGDAAETIARFARDKGIDMIILGTRGLHAVTGFLLGSVGAKIVREATAPVLLVK